MADSTDDGAGSVEQQAARGKGGRPPHPIRTAFFTVVGSDAGQSNRKVLECNRCEQTFEASKARQENLVKHILGDCGSATEEDVREALRIGRESQFDGLGEAAASGRKKRRRGGAGSGSQSSIGVPGLACLGWNGVSCDKNATEYCDILYERPSEKITSVLAAEGFVFVMKRDGLMKRCEEGKPESCTDFNALKPHPIDAPWVGGGPMIYLRQGSIIATSRNDMVVCSTTSANGCTLINQCGESTYYRSLLVANNRIYAGLSSGTMWSCDATPVANSCKDLNKAGSPILSLAYGDGVLWAGLSSGTIWRCDPNTPNSCKDYYKADNAIYSLLLTNGVLLAGLHSGTMWKCLLDQPDSCDRLNNLKSPVRQLIQMPNDASNIYASTETNVYRCPVASRDSCETVVTATSSTGCLIGSQSFFPGSKYNPSQASNPNPSQQTCCVSSDDVDVSIAKIGPGDLQLAGREFDFTLSVQVKQAGKGGVNDVNVTDTLPAGLVLVSAVPVSARTGQPGKGNCSSSGAKITCNIGAMSLSETVFVIVRVKGTAAGSWTNVATVNATGDTNPSNNQANSTVQVACLSCTAWAGMCGTLSDGCGGTINCTCPASAPYCHQRLPGRAGYCSIDPFTKLSVALQKTGPATDQIVGEAFNFALRVRIVSGTKGATSVVLVDTLPTGLELVEVKPDTGCTVDYPSISCELGPMLLGESKVVTVTAKTARVGTFDNAAAVSATDGSTTSNDTSKASVTVVRDPANDADMSIAKSVSSPSVLISGQVNYTITATNVGAGTATGVIVNDTLPAGLAFATPLPAARSLLAPTTWLPALTAWRALLAHAGCSQRTQVLTCGPSSVAAGDKLTYLVPVKAVAVGSWNNSARVSADNDVNPYNNGPVVAPVTVTRTCAQYYADGSRYACSPGSKYNPSQASNPNPSQQACCTDCKTCYDFPDLCGSYDNGCGTIITCTCPPDKPYCHQTDLLRGNSDPGFCSDNPFVPSRDLDVSIAKSGPTDPQLVGTEFDFTLTVRVEKGSSGANDVNVTDALPAGLVLVSAKPDKGNCFSSGATITCNIGAMSLAETVFVSVRVKGTAAGSWTNVATVNATGDTNPSNDQANSTVQVACLSCNSSYVGLCGTFSDGCGGFITCTCPLSKPVCNKLPGAPSGVCADRPIDPTALADIAITETGPTTTQVIGQVFDFKLTATVVDGLDGAKNVVITDRLPGGLELVAVRPDTGCTIRYPVITCAVGDLAFAGTYSLAVTVKAARAGSFNNRASANATNDRNQGNSKAEARVTVVGGACCTSSGRCLVVSESACVDGVYNPGQNCGSVTCARKPTIGSCCVGQDCRNHYTLNACTQDAGNFYANQTCNSKTSPVRESACVNGTWTQNANCTVDVCPAAFCVPTWRMCEPCTLPGCNPCCDSTSACKPVYGIHTSWSACKPGEGCRPEGQPCGECGGGGVCCDGLTCKWDHYGKRGVCTKPFACKQIGQACAVPRDCCPGSTCGTDGKCRPCDCKRKCRKHDQRCAAQREAECQMLSAAAASAVLTGPSGALIQVGGR
ncbi:hypothetical protein HT031_006935 [Scenedesmus sp. PABB004]|nr:hypothetical protein HT031_006935 [Scenedesmus sp. PABB004]